MSNITSKFQHFNNTFSTTDQRAHSLHTSIPQWQLSIMPQSLNHGSRRFILEVHDHYPAASHNLRPTRRCSPCLLRSGCKYMVMFLSLLEPYSIYACPATNSPICVACLLVHTFSSKPFLLGMKSAHHTMNLIERMYEMVGKYYPSS